MKGKFITFEGIDGSGKSSMIQIVFEFLQKKGYNVAITREPGGTELSEKIRSLLFLNDMSPKTECLLFAASRSEHVEKTIKPLLAKGFIVLSDRYVDSSISYQSFGRDLLIDDVTNINNYATDGLKPDLTLYFSVDVKTGLERTKSRIDNNRMDEEKLDFYYKVKRGYDTLAENNRDRIKIVDANQSLENVEKVTLELVESIL